MKRFECCTDKRVSERERLTAAPALHAHSHTYEHTHTHTHLQTVINHFSLIFLVFLLLNLLSAIAQEYVYTPTHLCVCVCLLGCANSNNDVPRHGVKYLCNNNNYIKRKLQIKRITKESFNSAGLLNTLLRKELRSIKVMFCGFD